MLTSHYITFQLTCVTLVVLIHAVGYIFSLLITEASTNWVHLTVFNVYISHVYNMHSLGSE